MRAEKKATLLLTQITWYMFWAKVSTESLDTASALTAAGSALGKIPKGSW